MRRICSGVKSHAVEGSGALEADRPAQESPSSGVNGDKTHLYFRIGVSIRNITP